MLQNAANKEFLKTGSCRPDFVRNVCILAHVDHGKTTISDSLVATNGHISKRIAGNVRYLDDRKDEQERGITMKSSAISLSYKNSNDENMVINLIDTPGHIDFTSEVSAAIRVSDGALVVVDLIEGVCVQTRDALKHAFEERVKMILIINKLDRIIVEQQKSVDIIFQNILRIIEDCNAYIAELCMYDVKCTVKEKDYLFSPANGNVIFGSAVDGWGVTTKQIAAMFPNFVDETVESLNEKMWDFDYYILKGNIVKGAIEKKKVNLFISLFLNTIHYVYNTLRVRLDRSKYAMIVEKLQIVKETSEMKHTDAKIQTKAILQAWKPLALTILNQVDHIIPSPTNILKERFEYLVNPTHYFGNTDLTDCANNMINILSNCSKPDMPTIIYISKMFCTTKKILEQQRVINIITGTRSREEAKLDIQQRVENLELIDDNVDSDDENVGYDREKDKSNLYSVIALARVFSGVIKVGQIVHVLSPKYRPPPKGVDLDEYIGKSKHIKKVVIQQLYILLGRELTSVESVSAGNICGISGLEKYIARTGTLSSTPYTLPLTEHISLEPIVRNSIDCQNPKELPLLRKGLKFLKKIDSCVQVAMQETGELVLVTAGDVHLAKCIEDVKNIVSDIEINVSKPMVSIKETIVTVNKRIDISNTSSYAIKCNLQEIGLTMTVVVVPLPDKIVQTIAANFELLKLIEEFQQKSSIDIMMSYDNKTAQSKGIPKIYSNEILMERVKSYLKSAFSNCSGPWGEMWKNIWRISKKRDYINLLFNNTKDYIRDIFTTLDETDVRACLDHCIINGFDMCCRAGPICEEPLTHCAFIVIDYQIDNYDALSKMDNKVQFIAGVPAHVKECFRNGFKEHLLRLMEPIFMTDIQVNTRILGKVYSVVSRRHGKVLDAVGMDEVEKTFLVKAQIPVSESHNFANEIRKTTSGQANPNLRFSHYEVIDGDPFYNIDEDVDEDEEEETSNVEAKRASILRKEIRKRKGLKIDDQVVFHAEKQRTLNKKK